MANEGLVLIKVTNAWRGKKKKEPEKVPETSLESSEREIKLNDIGKILNDLKEIRTKTLIAEAKSFGNKISPQLQELRDIAIQLEKDSLKVDDIDKHLAIIFDYGYRS